MLFYPSLKMDWEPRPCRALAKRKKDKGGERNMRSGNAWIQFKYLLFTRYCAKCWENNSEQHRRGPQHHRPCTVAWLTAHTSSAITTQWNNVTGEQKAYVISKDSQRKQFLRSRGYPGDRSELGRSSWGWRGMRETLGSWSVVRQRLAPKV